MLIRCCSNLASDLKKVKVKSLETMLVLQYRWRNSAGKRPNIWAIFTRNFAFKLVINALYTRDYENVRNQVVRCFIKNY